MQSTNIDTTLLDEICRIARAAGEVILPFYKTEFGVEMKGDGSPVTEADKAADALIVPRLEALTPDIPVISEERVENSEKPDLSAGTFWLVDPLDGTKEFIHKRGDFTVNIGLIENGAPKMGVVLTPVDGRLAAGLVGEVAFEEEADGSRTSIQVREAGEDGLTIVASMSHRNPELEAYIGTQKVKQSISRGSALKFCLVARGEADLYPRTGPTMEWDTAAGHAVLLAAGGTLTDFDGGPFLYNKDGFLNGKFIARGR